MFGALYIDESGGDQKYDRVGIATCIGSVQNWDSLNTAWAAILKSVGREFHAVDNSRDQHYLNAMLAALMVQAHIGCICVTLRESDYKKGSRGLDTSRYGDVFGFARWRAAERTAAELREFGQDKNFGYYVEQGGRGFEQFMVRLAAVYQDDELRKEFRMATYGPVDRRVDLPVHTADLVAHEVITSRHKSLPLDILGENVEIFDLTVDLVRDTLEAFLALEAKFTRIKSANKRARKKR